MTRDENTLITLVEECAEVQQAASKAMRFGMDNFHPERPEETNWRQLLTEYYQLIAVMDYAQQFGIIPEITTTEIEQIKISKVKNMLKYQNVSASLGIVRN